MHVFDGEGICGSLGNCGVKRSVLQCVAVHCVRQCVACVSVCYSVLSDTNGVLRGGTGLCCSVLQCVAMCCSVLQCVAVCCILLQCVAVCCSVL